MPELVTINEFFAPGRIEIRDYPRAVDHILERVFDAGERAEFDERIAGMEVSGKPNHSLPVHNAHGQVADCKHCRFELAEILLRRRLLPVDGE